MLPEDDVRETPGQFFGPKDELFSFTLDACATHGNHKVSTYYTETGLFGPETHPGQQYVCLGTWDGLTGPWSGRVWINPPFSQIPAWVAKCWRECEARRIDVIYMLVPATRTEQKWWQKMIEPYRDGRATLVEGYTLTTEFISGRTKFLKDGVPMGSPKFGCVGLIWKKEQ
jgi:hypothetical protein